MSGSTQSVRSPRILLIAVLAVTLALYLSIAATWAAPLAQKKTEADFAAIDSQIETQMRDLHIPGLALGIVQGDQLVYLKGFGIADPSGRPVTPQTPFQIASLGKPMTGVAIMQLVEQGKIELDAPVQRYLPWFRVADEATSAQMTVRHLLYHTSGLPGTVGLERALRGDQRADALEARVRELHSVQINRPLGAGYEYANAGYMILGLLIQQVSGKPYTVYLQDHLFAPLEMNHAFTEWDDAKAQSAAIGYRYWFGIPLPGEMAFDRATLPSGGQLSASAEDMTHFLMAHLNGGRFGDSSVLSPEGIAAILQPVMPVASQVGTGTELLAMDWGVVPVGGVDVVMKGGDNADFKATMMLIPEQRLGVVVLINANDGLATYVRDFRISLISYNVVEALLGQPLTVFPMNRMPVIVNSVVLLILVLQVGGIVLTLVWLRRRQTMQAVTGLWLLLLIGLPLVLNVAWGGVALVGLPYLLGIPLSFVQYLSPGLGYALLVSGLVALGWGVVRTVLVYRALVASSPPITSFAAP